MFDANLVDAQHQADQIASSNLLLPLLRPGTVRIYSAFDLGQPLLVLVDHSQHTHDAADCDGDDRDQQGTQTKQSLKDLVHPTPPQATTYRLATYTITRQVSGGADRDRTGGLLVANQALSQLSYSPNPAVRPWSLAVSQTGQRQTTSDQRLILLVGLDRLELSTSPLSGVRSSHLSYRPGLTLIIPEPCSFCRLLASSH
jgi:hypothetical protein